MFYHYDKKYFYYVIICEDLVRSIVQGDIKK